MISPISRFELAIAVGDAVLKMRRAAHFRTKEAGGNGAARETVESSKTSGKL